MFKALFNFLVKYFKRIFAALATSAAIGTASITSAVISIPSSSEEFVATEYDVSVSAVAMCNLAAESAVGSVKEIFINNMDLDENKVSGWSHIVEGTDDNDFSYALWVNKYENTTYCLSFAGSDTLEDTLDYLPMEISESRSSQTHSAAEKTKELKERIETLNQDNPEKYGTLENLYICGHSLGGYLAMYIASDIVDSALGYTNTIVSLDDLGWSEYAGEDLTNLSEKLHCFTFGAPGMHCKGEPLGLKITEWQKQKIEIDKQNKYDDIIIQYCNSKDPVCNLLYPFLDHIGTKMYYQAPIVSFTIRYEIYKKNKTLFASGAAFTFAYYHLPWVYINIIS